MSIKTPIEWCDSSANITSGCDGCEILSTCYAKKVHEFRLARNFPDKYDADFRVVRLIPVRLQEAARWKDLRGVERPNKPWLNGKPRHVFISDMSDALSEDVPFEYLKAEIIDVVRDWPHIGLWLTKRPKRMAEFDAWLQKQGVDWPVNLYAGTSITGPKTLHRVEQLVHVRAAVRFLSIEPLLAAVDPWQHLHDAEVAGRLDKVAFRPDDPWGIHWVICGGESGPGARPMHPAWARALRNQCFAADVPFFFKQWGAWMPADSVDGARTTLKFDEKGAIGPKVPKFHQWPDGWRSARVGNRAAGRMIDACEWNEMPEVIEWRR
jgi:protein gp37